MSYDLTLEQERQPGHSQEQDGGSCSFGTAPAGLAKVRNGSVTS